MSCSTDAWYSRLYVLSDDGTYDVMIGNNGSTQFTELASNDISINGNNITITMPNSWGVGRFSYEIYG